MTCVKHFSVEVKRAGEGSIKWNEYVLDGVWSSDLYSTSHSHGASVTPSPSGYNKASQWCSEPRRLSHLRHLSVCARTPTLPLPADCSAFFLCASCTLPPSLLPAPSPLPYLQTLPHFTLSLCTIWVQPKVNKISSVSLFSKYPLLLYLPSFLTSSLFLYLLFCLCMYLSDTTMHSSWRAREQLLLNTAVWVCICVCTSKLRSASIS